MIPHETFTEYVKTVLVGIGVPIAETGDPSLSSGAFLEVFDDEELPPKLFLRWVVHPVLSLHFRSLGATGCAATQVREMMVARSAMNEAITKILTASGFQVGPGGGEQVGGMFITTDG